MNGSRKRSRSLSTMSVSIISTNISRSPSPKQVAHGHTGQSQLLVNLEADRKRRRSTSTSTYYTSDSSHDSRRRDRSQRRDDKFRRRRSSVSPDGQKREINIQRTSGDQAESPERRRRPYTRPRSISSASQSSFQEYRRRPTHDENRTKRRRHSSRSPNGRGRDRDLYNIRGSRRTRSPSESRHRSQVIRNRKSMTPGVLPRRADESQRQDHQPSIDRRNSYSTDNDRYGGSARDRDENTRPSRPPPSVPTSRKDRSLSPFSKRLALTQAMNMGR